jgi:hypothetical protein
MFFKTKCSFPEKKIAMTVPVSTWVSVSSDGTEEFREMCFFIGEEFQENPPKPTNELVFIKERPTMTIFTRLISKTDSGYSPVIESQTEVG